MGECGCNQCHGTGDAPEEREETQRVPEAEKMAIEELALELLAVDVEACRTTDENAESESWPDTGKPWPAMCTESIKRRWRHIAAYVLSQLKLLPDASFTRPQGTGDEAAGDTPGSHA